MEELSDLLLKHDITKYDFSEKRKSLHVYNKQDFDILCSDLNNGLAYQRDPNQYGVPYSFSITAFFDYKGWNISGIVTVNKS